MWAIGDSKGGKSIRIYASSALQERDQVDAYFTLYRGPNKVIWICREPTKEIAEDLNFGTRVIFYVFKNVVLEGVKTRIGKEHDYLLRLIRTGSRLVIKMEMAVISKNWHQGTLRRDEGMKIILIPQSMFALKYSDDNFFYKGGTMYNKRETLKTIFAAMTLKLKNNCRIISDPKTESIEYRNYISYTNFLDTIDKISNDNILEYFCDDGALVIAKMVTDNPNGEPVSQHLTYKDRNNYRNTIFKYKYNYRINNSPVEVQIEVCSGGYADALPLPGTEINLFDRGKRVVFLHYHSSERFGTYSNFIVTEKVTMPRELLYDLLPDDARKMLVEDNIQDYPYVLFANYKKYIDYNAGETIRRHADIDAIYSRHDAENIHFGNSPDNPVIFEGSPYAGDEVGVQYPKNVGAKVVAVAPDKKYGNIVAVSQLYQENKMPKRSGIEDYRITMPNGGTIYYDTDKKMWINITKGRNILAVDSNISHDKVPGSSELSVSNFSTYIQLGKSNEDGASYIHIKCGNKEITIDDTNISISGDVDISGKLTVSGDTDLNGKLNVQGLTTHGG